MLLVQLFLGIKAFFLLKSAKIFTGRNAGAISAAEMGKALRFQEPKGFSFIGGADGTRTRDPRRDRPVF